MRSLNLPTIDARFDERNNGVTALRFLLAASVLLFHAWPVGGFGPDPVETLTAGQVDGGGILAVFAFFTLSGFLLGASRDRLSPAAFAWRRALRILPGYWVCILATSLFVGPAYFAATWLISDGIDELTTPALSGPMSVINVSLWTLWPEVICYAILTAIPRAISRIAAPALVVLGIGLYLLTQRIEALLLISFYLGVAIRHHGQRVPLHGAMAGGLILVAALASALGLFTEAAPFVIGYAAIWLAVRLPWRWTTDVSYGLYIYAFPISQALVVLGFAGLGLPAFAAACLASTLLVASVSWYVVERPALELKRAWPLGRWRAPAPLAPDSVAIAPESEGELIPATPQ